MYIQIDHSHSTLQSPHWQSLLPRHALNTRPSENSSYDTYTIQLTLKSYLHTWNSLLLFDMYACTASSVMSLSNNSQTYLFNYIKAVIAVSSFRSILGVPVRPPYHADRPFRLCGYLNAVNM